MNINLIAKSFILTLISCLSSCALVPGMKESSNFQLPNDMGEMEIQKVVNITPEMIFDEESNFENYKIAKGDTLSIIVFGEPDYFPTISASLVNPYTSRLVDEKGIIFFPFVGEVIAEGLTISEVRKIITNKLSKYINDPQVDVSIAKFSNNRNIYILGEVSKPQTINLDLVQITLADALSLADGLSPITSNPRSVFIIRRQPNNMKGFVYKADMNDVSKFLLAGEFKLLPGDIIYVGPSDITKWNRFISQLFPFASFLNQVDNIEN